MGLQVIIKKIPVCVLLICLVVAFGACGLNNGESLGISDNGGEGTFNDLSDAGQNAETLDEGDADVPDEGEGEADPDTGPPRSQPSLDERLDPEYVAEQVIFTLDEDAAVADWPVLRITNNTPYEIWYGSHYSFFRFNGLDWEPISFRDGGVFPGISYFAEPGGNGLVNDVYFGALDFEVQEGRYCVVKPVTINGWEYDLAAEFQIDANGQIRP